jgi:hypothetical protein
MAYYLRKGVSKVNIKRRPGDLRMPLSMPKLLPAVETQGCAVRPIQTGRGPPGTLAARGVIELFWGSRNTEIDRSGPGCLATLRFRKQIGRHHR